MMIPSGRRATHVPAMTTLACAVAGILLLASSPSMAQMAYQDPGQAGNENSWKTPEFSQDWGLQAIGAEYAYARGLSGAGINVGIMDTGVARWHADLQGRVRGITSHEPGCASPNIIAGPDACFYSDGSETITYTVPMTQKQLDELQREVEADPNAQRKLDYLLSLEGYKYNTHGSHVAGTIAANRNGAGSHGVAFAANVHASAFGSNTYQNVQALLEQDGGIYFTSQPSSELMGSMYAEMASRGVRVVNNSWGLGNEPETAQAMAAFAQRFGKSILDYTAAAKQNDVIQVWGQATMKERLPASMPPFPASTKRPNRIG